MTALNTHQIQQESNSK